TYVPVSPLENFARASATEASALSEALSSYRLPSTSNSGRLYVADAPAGPVKVSLSAAYNPTAEPTSTITAVETIDDLFMVPSFPLRLFTGFLLLSCRRNPTAAGRPERPDGDTKGAAPTGLTSGAHFSSCRPASVGNYRFASASGRCRAPAGRPRPA